MVDRMRAQLPALWDSSDVARVREGMEPTSSGVPLKRVYGSDYPYREAARLNPIESDGVDSAISFGRGGFSNVWGSAMLPYNDRDLGAWPIQTRDLEPHYRAVLDFVPISAVADDLAIDFPIYAAATRTLDQSRQTASLISDLERSKAALNEAGVQFGRSRLAVAGSPAPAEPAGACLYCGLCMYGCPHELIYSTAHTLRGLMMRDDFHYVPDVVVERVEERGGTVRISAHEISTDATRDFDAERVYLACGPVATPRLLMRSMEMYETPVHLLDSQYFLFPLLRYSAPSSVTTEPLHTLAQAFVEISDSSVARDTVHLQLYSYNDMYDATFRSMLGKLHALLRVPVDALVRRMFIVQGYLHSDISPRIEMTLCRRGNAPDLLRLRAVEPLEPTGRVVARLTRKLLSLHGRFRAAPVTPMLKIAQPGRGFHSGGSFPMRERPSTELESDVLGRPRGYSRVHVVDASVFPSIPATTITLTVMANAHRIGARYHET